MTETTERLTRLEAIDRDACIDLLARHHLGRLAVSIANQPVIFPVTYALDGHSVVFRTDPGTKLYGARDRKVAFEIDGVDDDHGVGWSVLVVGRAEVVNPSKAARLEQLDLGEWNPGPRQNWVRIRAQAITGRRLVRVADDF